MAQVLEDRPVFDIDRPKSINGPTNFQHIGRPRTFGKAAPSPLAAPPDAAIVAMRSRGSADQWAVRPALLQQVDQQMDRPLLGRPTRPRKRGRRNAMPYMPSANSTKIDQFIDKIAKQLESVERYFIMLAALVYAADEVGFFVPENWGKDGDKTPARERYFALVSMAREKAQDVARELDASFRLLTERGMFFADVFDKGDANAKVDEALDEALFVLGSAGTQPPYSLVR
jgi:hypothetical protein